MEVKNNVRQRRQDRIRMLQLHHKDEFQDNEGLSPYYPDSVDERKGDGVWPRIQAPAAPQAGHALPAWPEAGSSYDPRLEDPEYVWKQREKELLEQYGYGKRDDAMEGVGWNSTAEGYGGHESGGQAGQYGGYYSAQTGYGARGKQASPGTPPEPWRFVPSKRSIAVKLLVSGLLFGFIWFMYQTPQPWAQTGQKWVRYALNEDMQFAKITAWYKETFSGSPSFLPTFRSTKDQESQKVVAKTTDGFIRPVKGKLLEPFASGHPWVVVQTGENAVVRALDTGRVISAGNREPSGFTVVMQHASGYQSTYGLLQPSSVQQGDWLEAGEAVGKVAQTPGQTVGRFYFSLSKELRAIDPADVVTFD
ncbi:peptidoglycan DD-metalloendopeptidase family protein [Paenibacillus sp. MBLB4367]|uniref:peptidoglycan DD-metalloendopeptidase family protein n=1 Tax=Paenibacillus sp. MBLB4367 TaxID=3384767 RepID=UPI00390838C4